MNEVTQQARLAAPLALLHSRIALSVWAGAMAAGFVFGSARLLEVPHPAVVIALAFSAMVFTYAIDRALDPDEEHAASRRLAATSGLVWSTVAAFVWWTGHGGAALHSVVFPLAGLAYSRPWMRLNVGRRVVRRMKDLHVAKPIYVALVWSQLAVAAGLFAPRRTSMFTVAVIGTWVFAKFVVNTVACDLPDVEADRAHGVATWPVLIGYHPCVRLLQVLNATAAAPVLLCALAGILPIRLAWVELLALYYTMCLGFASRGTGKSRTLFKAIIDAGTALVILAVVVVIPG